MQLTPYTELKWAYQLHYYLCFQAHRRRSLFISDERVTLLQSALREICGQHDYHLLQFKTYPDHLRCLVSLRPNQAIATAIQKIKDQSQSVPRVRGQVCSGATVVGAWLPRPEHRAGEN